MKNTPAKIQKLRESMAAYSLLIRSEAAEHGCCAFICYNPAKNQHRLWYDEISIVTPMQIAG